MTEKTQTNSKIFSLKYSNYVFLFTYILIALISFFAVQEFSSYVLGSTFGRMLGTLVISTIFGYVCWLFSFKNKIIGEWGFNLMVLYIIFVLLSSSYKLYQLNSVSQDFQIAENEFDAVLKQEDSSVDEIRDAYKEYKDSMYATINKQVENSSGKSKQAILIQEAYLREIEPALNNWQDNIARFLEKDVLDPSMIKVDPVVYQNRLKTIQNMLISTLEYKEIIINMEDQISERLLPLNLSRKQYDQIVKDFIYSPDFTIEQLEFAIDSLIAYLDQSRKVLNILNYNQDKWFFEGNEFFSEDDDFIMDYNLALENLWMKEAKFQELFQAVYKLN
ncbi:hypothetical protein [Marinicella litoralis]|uniref:Uncharacterized protein n=1 Tax=Marinicella litoralis TaxID=644220 RepID=A0A4R6XG89_9GAMM|nr:hypothetical protein [Marinicella litoralis]TDR16754.1 hypothetical protein C8D91_2660 [Marinicella litoralis]